MQPVLTVVPEASFFKAHASLSHWMLCCSLDALLAMIICEALFLPMKKGNALFQPVKKGNSPRQDKPG